MLSGIKNASSLAQGQMTANISLPTRPTFTATEVGRGIGTEKQYIVGGANYPGGIQDMITIWLPAILTPGEHIVSWGTGLIRNNNSVLLPLGLTGKVVVEFPGGADHVKGTFDLLGAGFTVKGAFDIKGLDPVAGHLFEVAQQA